MKITVDSSKLLKALDNVQGVVDKRNTTPILSNIRISTNGGQLEINATDMDLDIVEKVEAVVIEEGSTTASAHIMFETVKRLPGSTDIEISLVDDKLEIKSGKFKGNLQCLPVEDFPIIKLDSMSSKFKIETSNLKKLIDRTKFAISLDETRYYLNGIYLHIINNESGQKVLRAVSTDGHRLALADTILTGDASAEGLEQGIIIPKKAVDELNRLLDKLDDSECEIAVSNTRISLYFKTVVLTSKLIDGNFPNYNKVIPVGNDKSLEVNRNDFVNAVNLISTYSDDKLKAVKLEINASKVKITAARSDALAEQELDIATPLDEMVICFNSKYITDIAALIKTEKLIIKLSSSSTPALIKKQDSDDEIFVIMPMRV